MGLSGYLWALQRQGRADWPEAELIAADLGRGCLPCLLGSVERNWLWLSPGRTFLKTRSREWKMVLSFIEQLLSVRHGLQASAEI